MRGIGNVVGGRVGNSAINVWELFGSWVPFVVGSRTEVRIALDWTDYAIDKHETLVASLVSPHGRATPLVWLTGHKDELKGHRFEWEKRVLERLRETLPATTTTVVILMDRGFGNSERCRYLQEAKLDFVCRIKGTLLDRSSETPR